MHDIRILDAAAHELKRLDKPVGRRIVKRIRWLVENMDEIQPESLTGNLAGFYKLRVGDYRIIYEILHADQASLFTLSGIAGRFTKDDFLEKLAGKAIKEFKAGRTKEAGFDEL